MNVFGDGVMWLCVVVWLFNVVVQDVSTCNCYPKHPQQAYCSKDFGESPISIHYFAFFFP